MNLCVEILTAPVHDHFNSARIQRILKRASYIREYQTRRRYTSTMITSQELFISVIHVTCFALPFLLYRRHTTSFSILKRRYRTLTVLIYLCTPNSTFLAYTGVRNAHVPTCYIPANALLRTFRTTGNPKTSYPPFLGTKCDTCTRVDQKICRIRAENKYNFSISYVVYVVFEASSTWQKMRTFS